MPWTYVIVAAIFFFLGFVSGFYAAGALSGANRRDVRLYLALLITLTWIMSVAAGIIVDGYQSSIALHAIMGAVAGYFFATGENPITGRS